jgi:hypothetical protein
MLPSAGESSVGADSAGIVTAKGAAELAVPLAVEMLMTPETAPVGTVARTCVEETNEKLVAATPPKRTAVAPVRFVPVIVTTVPTGPLVGVKLVMVGVGTVTINEDVLVAEPLDVVTVICPVAAPAGTVTMICVAVLEVIVPFTPPPKRTAVAPVRFVPVIVTDEPAEPLTGVKPVMVGTGVTVPIVKLRTGDHALIPIVLLLDLARQKTRVPAANAEVLRTLDVPIPHVRELISMPVKSERVFA